MTNSGSAVQQRRLDSATYGFLGALTVAEAVALWWVFSPGYPFQDCCNRNGAMAGFYVAVFVGLGLFFAAAALRGAHTARELRRGGIQTLGRVSKRRMVKGNLRRRTRYFVTYTYDYEGTSYTREEQVTQAQFDTWKPGAQLPVAHLLQVPRVAAGVGIDPGVEYAAGCAIISFAFVAFVVVVILMSLPHLRQ